MSHIDIPGGEKKTASPSIIEYAPRTYTLGEQIIFGIKLVAIGGLVLLAFWWFEKM